MLIPREPPSPEEMADEDGSDSDSEQKTKQQPSTSYTPRTRFEADQQCREAKEERSEESCRFRGGGEFHCEEGQVSFSIVCWFFITIDGR